MLIPLKLHRCLSHGLCISFEYNLPIILSIFSQVELSLFSNQCEHLPCILCAPLLLQLYEDCFETLKVLSHGLEVCILFGYNP